jgi:hypothetical protein
MQLADLLPALHQLARADKFRAVQFLTTELAQEEAAGLAPGSAYPIWSPHNAIEAASTLRDFLREQSGSR